MVCLELDALGLASTGIYQYAGNGYGAAQRWLAGELKSLGATLAIELHFNSSDSPASNGHEFLHWHASVKGKALAAAIDAQFDSLLPGIRHRSLVAITAQDRGAQFLRGTHCPAVIVESFFGSNAQDLSDGMAQRATIARAIACGIRDYLGKC
jgi:N-acetylmuramoyl-L-alanine amidase